MECCDSVQLPRAMLIENEIDEAPRHSRLVKASPKLFPEHEKKSIKSAAKSWDGDLHHIKGPFPHILRDMAKPVVRWGIEDLGVHPVFTSLFSSVNLDT